MTLTRNSRARNERSAPERLVRFYHRWVHIHRALPTLPHALASLLQTIVVALFVLTFVLQPSSHSLCKHGAHAARWRFSALQQADLWPRRPPQRAGSFPISLFIAATSSSSTTPSRRCSSKGWWRFPATGCAFRGGQVIVNGVALNEPYAAFETAPQSSARDNFPRRYFERSGFSTGRS